MGNKVKRRALVLNQSERAYQALKLETTGRQIFPFYEDQMILVNTDRVSFLREKYERLRKEINLLFYRGLHDRRFS